MVSAEMGLNCVETAISVCFLCYFDAVLSFLDF